MKKTVLYGLLAIILVFGYVGCDNGNDGGQTSNDNPFKGSWRGTIAEGPLAGQVVTIIIDDTSWQYLLASNYGQKGIYTYIGNIATMTITHQTEDGTTWTVLTDTFTSTISGSGNTMVANGTTLTRI